MSHSRYPRVPIVATLVAMTTCVSLAGEPQDVRRESCRGRCVVELQPVVTLTDVGHPGILPEEAIVIAVDRSGNFVVPARDLQRLVVADQRGRQTKVILGPGDRPFGMITNVVIAPNGAMQVYDRVSRTLITLGDDLTIAKVTPFRLRPALALSGGRYIHTEQIGTPALAGLPLHLVSGDGTVIRSFGSDSGVYRADEPLRYDRIAAPSSDGSLWSIPPGRYHFDKWNLESGARVEQVEVRSTWFREVTRFARWGERPVAAIEAIWEDGDVLWVLLRDADTNWHPPAPAAGREPSFDSSEFDKTYDSILEAIAVPSGQVIASRRFDRVLWGRSGLFFVSSFRRSATVGLIDVWKPRMVRKE